MPFRLKVPFRWVSHFVLGYMVLAFGWWAVHLWRQSDRLFAAEYALLESRFAADRRGVNETELRQTKEYQAIALRWERRRRMVLAEGLFFTGCLVFGLWVINRSANRELALAQQRRNFLLSITHELKSPIASIRLILETMGKHNLQREQQEKLCANALRDTARLQTLVESLLLAARLEDNWRPLPEPVDLASLVRECNASLQLRFPEAKFQVNIPEDFPPVQADKPGLTAVVQNLLENAVKYSPQGALVELSAARQNGKLCLRVADNGQGIPDAEKKAVFQKFYRLGNEETRHTTGTGLGLFIVQQVVKAHGGTIQIADNQPCGTVFTIDL